MCTKVDAQDFNIKLTDFGFAIRFQPNEPKFNLVLGSGLYMAPELH